MHFIWEYKWNCYSLWSCLKMTQVWRSEKKQQPNKRLKDRILPPLFRLSLWSLSCYPQIIPKKEFVFIWNNIQHTVSWGKDFLCCCKQLFTRSWRTADRCRFGSDRSAPKEQRARGVSYHSPTESFRMEIGRNMFWPCADCMQMFTLWMFLKTSCCLASDLFSFFFTLS